MFLFPLLYVIAFLYAFLSILRGDRAAVLIFFIFGISIYTTSLSIAFGLGFANLVPLLQAFKEIIVIVLFGVLLYRTNLKMKFHLVDYILMAYFAYTFLYVLIPLGEYSFMEKALAFKSTSFFCVVYATGRLMSLEEIQISRYFNYILVVSLAACVLVGYEYFTGQHFQTLTSYAEYNFYFYNYQPEGNYGLTWTFEIEGGQRRLASFFSDPLEHAASTLLALAVLAGLYTNDQNKLKLDAFGQTVLAATFISILLALSRASFVSYFIMIYAYAIITKKKRFLGILHWVFLAVCLYFVFLLRDKDLYQYILDTLTFTNASSVGHILEWLAGVEAIVQNPLGLGLGASGKVANVLDENIGGENQFIILGVQVGIIALLLYFFIQLLILYKSYQWYPKLTGRAKKLALMIFLLKVGIIIPLITTNFESYSYLNYIGWFFSGLFISMIMKGSESTILPAQGSHSSS